MSEQEPRTVRPRVLARIAQRDDVAVLQDDYADGVVRVVLEDGRTYESPLEEVLALPGWD